MLVPFFSRHTRICGSGKVHLGENDLRYHLWKHFSRHWTNTAQQRYFTEAFKGAEDQVKCVSDLVTLSETLSLPSLSRTPWHIHQYHTGAKSSSLCGAHSESSMASSSPLHGVQIGTKTIGRSISKSGQANGHLTAGLLGRTKGINQFRRVFASLNDRHPHGSNMIYRSLWYDTTSMSWNSNPDVESGCKHFHSSSFSHHSSGAAHDISLDGTNREEKLDNTTTSSQTALGDRTLKLVSGSCYLPHPDKEETGGEDAHFICVEEQAIGVADGVGGWADLGVDAGQYARELMSNSVEAIQQEPKGAIDPSRVLEQAYLCTKARGSSTACIIALADQGVHAVNLGDSGFIVVRDGCTVFRSPVQQHDFNFTYQLEAYGGNDTDLPSSAQVFTVSVAPGDVVIAGTDGLFDNLYTNEITAVVVHAIRAGLGPQVTAQKIAALARQRAQDKNRQTPFSTAAQDAGYRYYGGKLDDITVVVSYITASST